MENGEWRMENGEWRMENGDSLCPLLTTIATNFPIGAILVSIWRKQRDWDGGWLVGQDGRY